MEASTPTFRNRVTQKIRPMHDQPARRIAIIVNTFPVPNQTFIVDKFLHLLDRGFDVELFCRDLRSEEFRFFPALEARTAARRRIKQFDSVRSRVRSLCSLPFVLASSLAAAPSTTVAYLLRSWKRSWHWRALIRFYKFRRLILFSPRLIHIEFGVQAPLYVELGREMGCKTLVSFRGWALGGSPTADRERLAPVWEATDYIHCLTDDLYQRALKRGCPPHLPRALIPSSVDTDFFRRDGAPYQGSVGSKDRPLRILSVGRLDWKKGYEYALPAIRNLLERGIQVEYRIVGEGSHRPAVEYMIDDLAIEAWVRVVGLQDREAIRTQLEWCDVFLHAAVSEAFSNAVLEAQAMGVPIVTTDAGGLPENVDHGVTGFVVPRRDADALAERLVELARSPELRLGMGMAARERAVTRFNLSAVLAEFETLYDTVVTARPAAGG